MKNNILNKIKTFATNHSVLTDYFLVICIGILFSLWIIRAGTIEGHDLLFHLSRIDGIKNAIVNGDFQGLIHVGLYGYGYANGLFYGNFLLYLPAIIHLKYSTINSYKVLIILCSVLSAISMYWCCKGISKSNKAALLGSFLYSACSYRACDYIIRSAVGEIGAFIFLPLIILGFYYIVYDDYKKWFWFSIGFVGLLQCHILSTVLIAVTVVILLFVNIDKLLKEKKRINSLIISGLVGLVLGAHFIFPFLEGMIKNTLLLSGSTSTPAYTHTIPIERIFLGFPYYKTGWFTPPGIGIIFFILMSLRFKLKVKKNDNIIKFCDQLMIIGIISLLCATNIFPWQELRFMDFIQFPWRFYGIASLSFTIVSAIITYYYFKNKNIKEIKLFIIPILVIATIPTIIIVNYYQSKMLYNFDGFEIGNGEYLPVGTDTVKLAERGNVVTSNNDQLEFEMTRNGNNVFVNYSNNTNDNTYIEVPLLNYYGYTAVDQNNNTLKIINGDNNIIRINLKNEKGSIKVYYKGTFIQKISLILSIISSIGFFFYLIYKRKELLTL